VCELRSHYRRSARNTLVDSLIVLDSIQLENASLPPATAINMPTIAQYP
jgi:hypothetical protein